MLISLNWLKQYIDIKETTEELEQALTMIGQEVESIDDKGKDLHDVVIGQVVDYQMHPDSDHLTLLKVNVGEEEDLQIICGATNHKLGDKVVVAKIGAVLGGDFVIKKSKIRKVESFGMLCSEEELGLADKSEGIIILPEDAPVGEEYRKYAKIDDVIFELEITPNRPDCLSYIGIAREVGAYFSRKVKYLMTVIDEAIDPVSRISKLSIKDKDKCHRYMGRVAKNVKVEESPEWLQERIRSMGLKPVNNIVDITNFVMFECNQPMHAYDLDKLVGDEIIVRNAEKGEILRTLDGEERELNNGELVIADQEKALALAGIIGGADTQIDENTQNIFLEVANFTPENIRRTSRALGIFTDSSYRNERGMDPEGIPYAAARAISLIQSIAGGKASSQVLDKYVVPREKAEIPIHIEKINKFIGKDLETDTIGNILSNLDISVKPYGQNALIVTPPSYRGDLQRPADIYEEIIRMYGFDNIEAKMPKENIKAGQVADSYALEEDMKKLVSQMGLHEVINYSFIPKRAEDIMDYTEELVHIKNPLSEDMAVMRPNLVYSLVANISDNLKRSQSDLKFGEVSKCYVKDADSSLAIEDIHIGVALAGSKSKDLWHSGKESYDFYDMKAYIENIMEEMQIPRYQLQRTENKNFHPGRAVDVKMGRDVLGTFGEIHPDLAEKMDIKRVRVYVADLNLTAMKKYQKAKKGYEKVSKYPSVTRDLAIVLDKDVLVGDMLSAIAKKHPLIHNISLFDIYHGENIGEDKKSVAISILFQDAKRTLEEKDIESNLQSILKFIKAKYQGEIRQ